jgi:hypothetical protein
MDYSEKILTHPTSFEQREKMIQTSYYSNYENQDILVLLQFIEMVIFHSLILLISSKEQVDINDS